MLKGLSVSKQGGTTLSSPDAPSRPLPRWRAVVVAAWMVLATVPLFAAVVFTTPKGLSLQPADQSLPVAEFLQATQDAPTSSLLFFLTDSLFVLAFFWFVVTLARATTLRLFLIAAGAIKALADLTENLLFARFTLAQTLEGADLTALFFASDVKRWAAIISVALLSWVYPRDKRRGTLICLLLALAAVLGIWGYFEPRWHLAHPHVLLATLPLILWDARARR